MNMTVYFLTPAHNHVIILNMKIRAFFIIFIALMSLSCRTERMSRQGFSAAGSPVITIQPKNAEYLVRNSAGPLSVTAIADGGGALSYQWYKSTGNSFTDEELAVEFEKIKSGSANDIYYFAPVSGAEDSTYTPDAASTGRFNYFCAVTNTSADGKYTAVTISNPAVVTVVEARTIAFGLKSAPPDLTVSLNGEIQRPVSQADGIRNYRIRGAGTLRFSAENYISLEYLLGELPVRNGRLEIKLENENGHFRLLGEYSTGIQPKSAYFSPDGRRLFVPLLGQHGVDVFRFEQSLVFEKRLSVPGSTALGFVEALIDERRRELWVSNMEENKVHIFDLNTLEYKTSMATDGVFPKVITQNPDGSLTVVSNWTTHNISVFDSESKRLLRRIPVSGTPRGMAFSPDGRFLYTAIFDEPVIDVIDMTQNRVSTRYRFFQGTGAARHVIYRDGKLYVSDMYRGTVNILNASTGAVIASTRRLGFNTNTIVLSPDGRRLIASFRGRNNDDDYTRPGPEFGAVYILNADDLSIEERIWGRNQPTGLAVSPDGKYMVFTDFLDANLELYEMPLNVDTLSTNGSTNYSK